MKAVVMFSGGKGSFLSAKRAADRFGAHEIVLLFADTMVEDPDVYEFIAAGAAYIGSELVRVADGRTPFQVFHDVRFHYFSFTLLQHHYMLRHFRILPNQQVVYPNRDCALRTEHYGM